MKYANRDPAVVEYMEALEANDERKGEMLKASASMQLEHILNITNELGWALSKMMDGGVHEDNYNDVFTLQGKHRFLIEEANKIATQIYDIIIRERKND